MVSNDSLQPAHVRVADLVRGAHDVTTTKDGWLRPCRFAPVQLHALTSCMAWHPGLYRQMARTTAGVCLRFATDATEVSLGVRYDVEPSGTTAVLDNIPKRAAAVRRQADDDAQLVYDLRDHSVAFGPYDGFSVVVDGRVLGAAFPRFGVLRADLRDPQRDPGDGVIALPGLGTRHEVTIWLPCLRGCEVCDLRTNGTYVEPLGERPRLLVIGDSIGQGFCCGDPALSWPAILADQLGLELVNQSLAGQVFQPTSLIAADVPGVKHVVIELGLNYRWERCSSSVVKQDVRGVLIEASHRWSDAHIWIVTPLWFNRNSSPITEGSCYDMVGRIIRDAAQRYDATVVDGLTLMDHNSALFEDGSVHPGAKGHEQIAMRLLERMESEDPSLRAMHDEPVDVDDQEDEDEDVALPILDEQLIDDEEEDAPLADVSLDEDEPDVAEEWLTLFDDDSSWDDEPVVDDDPKLSEEDSALDDEPLVIEDEPALDDEPKVDDEPLLVEDESPLADESLLVEDLLAASEPAEDQEAAPVAKTQSIRARKRRKH